jgi:hypothetical protein
MSKYQFAISSGPQSVRQAGVVESDSFDGAVVLLGERIPVRAGDSLEIGVTGLPAPGSVPRRAPFSCPEGSARDEPCAGEARDGDVASGKEHPFVASHRDHGDVPEHQSRGEQHGCRAAGEDPDHWGERHDED